MRSIETMTRPQLEQYVRELKTKLDYHQGQIAYHTALHNKLAEEWHQAMTLLRHGEDTYHRTHFPVPPTLPKEKKQRIDQKKAQAMFNFLLNKAKNGSE